ncbi:MAG: bifunctional methylenetetrahydrofolate dehydrogenase/methenyltetrahydrofolate cyclohydrolase FolD [Synergistales bacterium]|nr:bifunctional methylenetetrahydrofolate dehydrogenase/methenyltetrahydrofolate cyclohydrolase FolD [Synergistales bacterium]
MERTGILNGRECSLRVREEIKREVEELKGAGQGIPGLAVVLVGDDPASRVYVGQKEKACGEVGFRSLLYRLPEETTQEELMDLVEELNGKGEVHGILVQLPLPGHMDSEAVLEAISPAKDVDGFHPVNMGHLVTGLPCTEPCTPKGIMYLLESYGIEMEGKKAVVLGRSNIVGKPIAHMLLSRNATVTICHSRTPDIVSYTREADIVIAAVGRPRFLTSEMVKEGSVIVDVGINRLEEGLVGDVDFEGVKDKASWITPVPGGVGPMTIAMLLFNTMEAFRKTFE